MRYILLSTLLIGCSGPPFSAAIDAPQEDAGTGGIETISTGGTTSSGGRPNVGKSSGGKPTASGGATIEPSELDAGPIVEDAGPDVPPDADTPDAPQSAGGAGSGGMSATGGTVNTGGVVATGGTVNTGGVVSTGGVSTGGVAQSTGGGPPIPDLPCDGGATPEGTKRCDDMLSQVVQLCTQGAWVRFRDCRSPGACLAGACK